MIKFFKDKKNILAVMSHSGDGSMRVIGDEANKRNRKNFLAKNGIDKVSVFAAEIVHSSRVAIVDNKLPNFIEGVDALVTKEKLFLSVTVADCIPVYFYDEKNGVVGLAHAGWRGIVGGIIKNTLNKMIKLGGNIKDIEMVLGPGIRACHFEIKEDIEDRFKKYPQFIISRDGKIFIDLFGIIKKEAQSSGVMEENIYNNGDCTFENKDKYFSYRRDKPEVVEAMMAVIGKR